MADPAEQVPSEIKGIEHVSSVSRPGMAVVTVEYRVGEDRTDAVVRLFSKVLSNQDWLPANLAFGTPIVKPKGTDDVPIITATLWSKGPQIGAFALGKVAHAIPAGGQAVPGTRDVCTIGGNAHQVVGYSLQPRLSPATGST